MIRHYGKHSTKQFVRSKTIRFWFKVFSIVSPEGYLYDAKPYCGADTHLVETSLGLGGNVVLSLAKECSMSAGFRLYFDNWFTSFNFLEKLKKKQNGGTGTIRAERCLNAPLPTKKEMEKSSRGEFFQILDGNHVIIRWHDNSVVSFAKNCIFSKRKHSVTRLSRTEKMNVKILMPQVVHEYNH